MLGDYVAEYIQARRTGNNAEAERIERDLNTLGMDKMSLMAIVKEMEENDERKAD